MHSEAGRELPDQLRLGLSLMVSLMGPGCWLRMEGLKGNQGDETEWGRVLLKSIFWLETSNHKYMSYILQVKWNKVVAWLDYHQRLSVRCKWNNNQRERMSNQSWQQGTSLGMGEMSGSWDWGIRLRSGQMTSELVHISILWSEHLKLLVDWVWVINWGQAQQLDGTGCNTNWQVWKCQMKMGIQSLIIM